MLRRVNPIILLGFIIGIVLSIAILATAQGGGGTAGEAVGVGEAQVGKPFVMATDGPDTFSCVGLMRHILRTIGVDPNAPWSPEAYLGAYAPVDLGNLQPGDIVIYPGWATMYVGGGQLLNANEMEGVVTHTPMDAAGTPLGAVRPPYGGSAQPEAADNAGGRRNAEQPAAAEEPAIVDPAAIDPAATDPTVVDLTLEPVANDPAYVDPAYVDPAAVDPMIAAEEPAVLDSAAVDPAAVDPAAVDPAAQF